MAKESEPTQKIQQKEITNQTKEPDRLSISTSITTITPIFKQRVQASPNRSMVRAEDWIEDYNAKTPRNKLTLASFFSIIRKYNQKNLEKIHPYETRNGEPLVKLAGLDQIIIEGQDVFSLNNERRKKNISYASSRKAFISRKKSGALDYAMQNNIAIDEMRLLQYIQREFALASHIRDADDQYQPITLEEVRNSGVKKGDIYKIGTGGMRFHTQSPYVPTYKLAKAPDNQEVDQDWKRLVGASNLFASSAATPFSQNEPPEDTPFSQNTPPVATPFSQNEPPADTPFSQNEPPEDTPFSQNTPPVATPFSQNEPPADTPFSQTLSDSTSQQYATLEDAFAQQYAAPQRNRTYVHPKGAIRNPEISKVAMTPARTGGVLAPPNEIRYAKYISQIVEACTTPSIETKIGEPMLTPIAGLVAIYWLTLNFEPAAAAKGVYQLPFEARLKGLGKNFRLTLEQFNKVLKQLPSFDGDTYVGAWEPHITNWIPTATKGDKQKVLRGLKVRRQGVPKKAPPFGENFARNLFVYWTFTIKLFESYATNTEQIELEQLFRLFMTKFDSIAAEFETPFHLEDMVEVINSIPNAKIKDGKISVRKSIKDFAYDEDTQNFKIVDMGQIFGEKNKTGG